MLTTQKTEIFENLKTRNVRVVTDTEVKNRYKNSDLSLYKRQTFEGIVICDAGFYAKRKSAASVIRGVQQDPLREGYYSHHKGGVWVLKSNPAKRYICVLAEKTLDTFYYDARNFFLGGIENLLAHLPDLADQRGVKVFSKQNLENWENVKSYNAGACDYVICGKKYFFLEPIQEGGRGYRVTPVDVLPKEILAILRKEPENRVDIPIRYINIENVISVEPTR